MTSTLASITITRFAFVWTVLIYVKIYSVLLKMFKILESILHSVNIWPLTFSIAPPANESFQWNSVNITVDHLWWTWKNNKICSRETGDMFTSIFIMSFRIKLLNSLEVPGLEFLHRWALKNCVQVTHTGLTYTHDLISSCCSQIIILMLFQDQHCKRPIRILWRHTFATKTKNCT